MPKKSKWQLLFITITVSLLLGAYLPDCTDPQVTCLSVVDVAAKAIVRCEPGSNFEEIKQSLLETWALGDCRLIKKIRDPVGLINDCLPWLSQVSCSVLTSGKRPPACQNQLLLTTDEF